MNLGPNNYYAITLLFSMRQKDNLSVEVKNNLSCRLGDKMKMVSIENGNAGPTFKKNGDGLVLVFPNGHAA